MDIAAMTDQEVVNLMLGQTVEAQVRRLLHESAGRIEQSYGQAQGPTGVQVRRMELKAAAEIVALVRAAEHARIRQELLAAVLDDPGTRYEKGAAIVHENVLRRALNTVCPEEG